MKLRILFMTLFMMTAMLNTCFAQRTKIAIKILQEGIETTTELIKRSKPAARVAVKAARQHYPIGQAEEQKNSTSAHAPNWTAQSTQPARINLKHLQNLTSSPTNSSQGKTKTSLDTWIASKREN